VNGGPQHQKKAWDRQWRGKLLSTCLMHGDREASRTVIDGWVAFFAGLPVAAKILDVGTGNGFLPLLALEVSEKLGKKFEIHGSDYAAIDPVRAIPEQKDKFSRIVFHPETPTEHLPFEEASLDAITAQHALEYGDIEKAVGEAARVLKPGGKVRFALHAAESEIVTANLPKINQCRYILEEGKLFEAAEAAVRDALAGKGDKGEALGSALSEAANKFRGDANTGDLEELLGLLWGAYEARENFPDFAAFKAWLDENRAETEAQLVRIEAMRDAALHREEAENLKTQLKQAGFGDVALDAEQAPGGKQTGWLIEGERK